MYLVSLDFSKNNLLTEQLSVRSFYDLPILNCSLLQLQLINFSEIDIDKAYLIDCENEFEHSLFETINVNNNNFNKILFSLDNLEKILLIRNDVFFEADFSKYNEILFADGVISLEDKNGFCFGIICSVNSLKKLNSKNICFLDLIKKSTKFADTRIVVDWYFKDLSSVKSYKDLLFDIMNGKTRFKPPYVAEGIFIDGNMPYGDFSVVPPVFIGENVQIESGSTIGPNSVFYNNILVSTDTKIKNSIIFDNVYVSSGCYIDGAVCCENSSIKRNSAVFSGSVIGKNALIDEDMLVENGSLIKNGVKYGDHNKEPFTNKINHFYETKFQGLSPDKASILGLAIGSVFKKPKIIIASDGTTNSLSIKLALLSGLIASGAECFDMGCIFKSLMFFGLCFCECDYSIFISGKIGGTNIEIYNAENEILSKADCCNLFSFINKGEYNFMMAQECKNVRQIHGLRKMYIREISSVFGDRLNFTPIVNCKNPYLSKTMQDIFMQVGNSKSSGEKIYIIMNDSGTNVNIKYNNKSYSQKALKKLVHFYMRKTNDNFKNKYYEKLWDSDSVFLLFAVFDIIKKSEKNIDELIKELPQFFVASKSVDKCLKAGELSGKLSVFNTIFCKNGCYKILMKNCNVKVINNKDSDNIKILCSSENMSVSRELCDFVFHIFEDL